MMATGSAPIEQAVLDFLKVCFSCPIVEGYGLTETAGAGCVTLEEDTVSGHCGGPKEQLKMRLKSLPEMQYMVED